MAELDELDQLVEQGKEHIESTAEGTLLTVILDRSGSMRSLTDETILGFNTLMEDQKKEPGKAWVTLIIFDDLVEMVYEAKPLEDVPVLDSSVYFARGSTALYDAQGYAITKTQEYLDGLAESERPGAVLVVTVTDGGNNIHNDWSSQRVKDLIDAKQEKDSWDFVYTGANQDSFAVTKDIGIMKGATMDYAASAAGTQANYEKLSAGIRGYRGRTSRMAAGGQSVNSMASSGEDFFMAAEAEEKRRPIDPNDAP